MTSRTNTRRRLTASLRISTAAAALAVVGGLLLSGCTSAIGQPGAQTNSVPLPSPTGTWTPPAPTATDGPRTPAPLPTQSATLDQPVEFGTGVKVSLISVTPTTVTAQTPGEVSGPAVVVKVSVANNSTQSIDVDSAVVTLSADKGQYGVGTTAGPNKHLKGTVKPGASTEGFYVFMLDPAKGRSVQVSVNYAAGEPVAVFTGKTS